MAQPRQSESRRGQVAGDRVDALGMSARPLPEQILEDLVHADPRVVVVARTHDRDHVSFVASR